VTPQDHGNGEFKVFPAVFFTWFSSSDGLENWSKLGITAGFGTGQNAFAAFLGLSKLYNTVLQISAGGSLTQVDRLDGKYQVGQLVSENLSDDQLHRTVFWPGWYVGVTLRFGTNPFKEPAATQATESGDKEK
jgi:hypothetical protein